MRPAHDRLWWLLSLLRYPVAYRQGTIDERRGISHNPYDPEVEPEEYEDYANGWWGDGEDKYTIEEQT